MQGARQTIIWYGDELNIWLYWYSIVDKATNHSWNLNSCYMILKNCPICPLVIKIEALHAYMLERLWTGEREAGLIEPEDKCIQLTSLSNMKTSMHVCRWLFVWSPIKVYVKRPAAARPQQGHLRSQGNSEQKQGKTNPLQTFSHHDIHTSTRKATYVQRRGILEPGPSCIIL